MSEGNKRFKVAVSVDLTAIDMSQEFPASEAGPDCLSFNDQTVTQDVEDVLRDMFGGSTDLLLAVNVKHELVDA